MIKIITVPQDIVDNLQRLGIETESRKGVISFMLSSNMDITSDAFKKYETEYNTYFGAFEAAKKDLENEYVYPAIDNPINWSLDYATREVTINY